MARVGLVGAAFFIGFLVLSFIYIGDECNFSSAESRDLEEHLRDLATKVPSPEASKLIETPSYNDCAGNIEAPSSCSLSWLYETSGSPQAVEDFYSSYFEREGWVPDYGEGYRRGNTRGEVDVFGRQPPEPDVARVRLSGRSEDRSTAKVLGIWATVLILWPLALMGATVSLLFLAIVGLRYVIDEIRRNGWPFGTRGNPR